MGGDTSEACAAANRPRQSLSSSFACALVGCWRLLRTQRNARLHALATVAVVGLAAVLQLPLIDWAVLSLTMGLVWTAEAFNTALEQMLDVLHPEHHPQVGEAKDLAAAAVLLAAVAAIGVALAIFGPRLLSLWGAALPVEA